MEPYLNKAERKEIYQRALLILRYANIMSGHPWYIWNDERVYPLRLCILLDRLCQNKYSHWWFLSSTSLIRSEFPEFGSQMPSDAAPSATWWPDAFNGGIEIRIKALEKCIALCELNND